jgi:hypothetical protein
MRRDVLNVEISQCRTSSNRRSARIRSGLPASDERAMSSGQSPSGKAARDSNGGPGVRACGRAGCAERRGSLPRHVADGERDVRPSRRATAPSGCIGNALTRSGAPATRSHASVRRSCRSTAPGRARPASSHRAGEARPSVARVEPSNHEARPCAAWVRAADRRSSPAPGNATSVRGRESSATR